jgi:energy-coupling factor transporter ATP-binding protein EcfA2
MKILKLTIKDFLGIKEATIAPGKITVLAGKNGQGKTSILKAIEALFKGAPLSVVHQGTERAEIVAEMEDIRVSRVWTHKTTSVAVKDARGFVRPAPQGYLDGLFGNFAFNPLAFLLAEPKKRREILLKAMDVTATKEAIVADAGEDVPLPPSGPALEMYSEAHKYFYTRRTDVNRRLKQKRAAAEEVLKKLSEGYKPVEGIEEMAVATRELISEKETEIAVLEEQKRAVERAAKTRVTLEDAIRVDTNSAEAYRATAALCVATPVTLDDARRHVQKLREMLREAEADEAAIRDALQHRDRATAKAEEAEARIVITKATLAALPGAFDNEALSFAETVLAGLKGQRKDCDDEQARQRIWNEHVVLREEAEDAEEQALNLSALVERFGSDLPAKALREAKLPVEGLTIEGDNVAIGGIIIDQLSTEEQMRVTLSIARAMAKELPLVCVDGVERLDDDHFAEFTKQAASDGFQYFVTRVGTPREGEIEVSAGKVAAG